MKIVDKLLQWNNIAAVWLTEKMSTMMCAYLFLLWAVLPIMVYWTHDFVAYVSQAVIQLVALPIIMVGTKVSEQSLHARAEQDHNTLMEELELLHHIAEKLEIKT